METGLLNRKLERGENTKLSKSQKNQSTTSLEKQSENNIFYILSRIDFAFVFLKGKHLQIHILVLNAYCAKVPCQVLTIIFISFTFHFNCFHKSQAKPNNVNLRRLLVFFYAIIIIYITNFQTNFHPPGEEITILSYDLSS